MTMAGVESVLLCWSFVFGLVEGEQATARAIKVGWRKEPDGCGEWSPSGSFPFDKLRVRMTTMVVALNDNGRG